MKKSNAILIDMVEPIEWQFKKSIIENTEEEWEVIECISNTSQRGRIRKFLTVYIKYFCFPFKMFLKRKKFNKILSWQQFYGMTLAFYCRLFGVKKFPRIYLLCLIYQPKKGIIGRIYYKFVKYSLESIYISKIIIESSIEREKYSKLFNIEHKLVVCIEGLDNRKHFKSYKGDYFLSVGRTNRDYKFLIDAFNNRDEKLVIITDQKIKQKHTGNITILNNVFGLEYEKRMSECFALLLCMGNAKVSSGQLVILNAMRYGKPIIINDDECIYDYVKNGDTGLLYKKTSLDLFKAIELIRDDKNYKDYSSREKNKFEFFFTFAKFGERISEYLKD